MEPMLNDKGKEIMSMKDDFDKTPSSFKSFVIDGLKAKDLSTDIINLIKDSSSSRLKEYLLSQDNFKLNENDYMEGLKRDFCSKLEIVTKYTHYQTFLEGDFICIKKQLGILPFQRNKYFDVPREEIYIAPNKPGRRSKEELQREQQIAENNVKIKEEVNEFMKLYCKYRYPALLRDIKSSISIRDLEKNIKGIEIVFEGNCYYSDKADTFDTDLIIKVPYSIMTKADYSINNDLKMITSYIKKVSNYFQTKFAV